MPHILVCDANFGILPRDVEIATALVESYRERGGSFSVSVQSTKNATERSYQVHRVFAQAKVATVGATLALQSVDDNALKAVKRHNISLASYDELHRRYRQDGLDTYTDMILGLPGETYDSFADGISRVIANGQHNRIAVYNCSILPNAEMSNPEYQRVHGIEYVAVRVVQEFESLNGFNRNEAPEFLNTIIATRTMPRGDWVRSRIFAWMAELLHYDRLLQVVLVTLAETHGLSYREMIEAFIFASVADYPVCAEIVEVFRTRARAIQGGSPECVPSPEWLGLWWRTDQYALIKLIIEEKLSGFYQESALILQNLMARRRLVLNDGLLTDAVVLNRSLLRIPGQVEDAEVSISHNVLELYQGVIAGCRVPLVRRPILYRIDRTNAVWPSWREWCLDVILQVYRRDKFLYDAAPEVRIPIPTGEQTRF